jgi:hypothetical protein
MSGYQQPPQYPLYSNVQQADAEATRIAQEYQEAQKKAAEAAAEANRIAEEQRQARMAAQADQANRIGWSSQRR